MCSFPRLLACRDTHLASLLALFPFALGAQVAEIYRAILSLQFIVPIGQCNISPEAADLLQRLLVTQPHSRLVGAQPIKQHPLFREIDWTVQAQPGGAPASDPSSAPLTVQSLAEKNGALPYNARGGPGMLTGGSGATAGRNSGDSKTSGGTVGSILSAASTNDFHLQLQTPSVKNQCHLDNLTGLNDMIGANALGWAGGDTEG